MLKQILLQVIDEVNQKFEVQDDFMKYAYQLDGTRIKSFMEIHQKCRVILVSNSKNFKGLHGLDSMHGFHDVKPS